MKIALVIALLFALAFIVKQAWLWFIKPEPSQVRAAQSKRERSAGGAPNVWVPKKWGPLGVRAFRAADWLDAMVRAERRHMRAMANVGGAFSPRGCRTYYPTDVIPNSASNPYNNARYSLVKQAAPGTVLGATLQWGGLTISSDSLCTMMAAGDISVPLGICTDEPGGNGSTADSAPFGSNVQLLGAAAHTTMQAIADSVIAAGRLLVPSSTTAGNVGNVPNIAGVYWCVGLSLSTSEGAQTEIDIDQGRFPISVDEIT